MLACTSGSTALSIRPSTDPQTTRAPSRMMLAATQIATTGSSQSQPVSWTRATPTTTPAEVQTSV